MKSAILIIDLQVGLFDEPGKPFNYDSVISKINALTAIAIGYQIQIVSDGHTTHNKEHASADFIIIHHNETLPNITSFGVEISANQANEIMEKIG